MERITVKIDGIPAIIWGETSKRLYLYIHGQGGYKEEAEDFSNIACLQGWQVLSIDLPEHGERANEPVSFDPWHVVPELSSVIEYAKCRWEHISLFASSIGAWFSMLSFKDEQLDNCLFVSPILDMKRLISNMMNWANVSEARLKYERIIPTSFGQTLSWEYWEFALNHPITKWKVPTKILYGENDNLTELDVINQFTHRFHCDLSIMGNGEHWFHTEEQMNALRKWADNSIGFPSNEQ